MPQLRLTSKAVEALKLDRPGQVDYWDTLLRGFGVRLSRRGRSDTETRTYYIRYRVGTRRMRRCTIGNARDCSLAEARARARAALTAVEQGEDPTVARRLHRQAQTFEELAECYVDKHAKRMKRSWQSDARLIRVELLPHWRDVKVRNLGRPDVRDVVESIAERGAPIQANRTLALVRKMLNFAIDRGWIDANPASRMAMPGAERRRDRVLSSEEIRTLWRGLDVETQAGRIVIATFFRVRLLTAQRGQEVAHMRWGDLDPDDHVWTLPAEFAKNGLVHRVPLSPPVWDLLETVRAWQRTRDDEVNRTRVDRKQLEPVGASQWVFPSPRRDQGDRPLQRNLQKAVDRLRRATEVEFTPHDLRRTAASHMAAAGVSRDVIKKILNHVDRDVTATYDRYSYDREKRAALDAWADRVHALAQGDDALGRLVDATERFRRGSGGAFLATS